MSRSAPRIGRHAAVLAGLAAGLCAWYAGSGTARAEILLNPYGWKFPNILTAAKESIKVSDRTPLIPGKETIMKGYRKADGTHFQTYEIESRIFGVEIDTDGKPPFEYSLLDTDGDGKFETKIPHTPGSKDRAYVPKWVIDHYYSKHPELKNPQGSIRAAPPTFSGSAPPPPEPPKPAAPQGPLPEEIRRLPTP